MKSTKL